MQSLSLFAGVLLGEDSAFHADGVGSNPITRSKCPDGGIGRHAGLRSQCFGVRVRVSLGAPKFLRSGEEESRQPHKLENGGANPSSATKKGSVAESGLRQQS